LKKDLFLLPLLAALLASQGAWAKCSVMNSDLGKISTSSVISKRSASTSNIQPCAGRALADVSIWFYTEPNRMEMAELKAGDSLDRYESRAKGANHSNNLEKVVFGGGLQIQTLNASGRFDPIAGLILGETILPDEPLLIPLGLYDWSESEKVTLSYGKQRQVLTPKNGMIRVDIKRGKINGFSLKQGAREATFEFATSGLDPEFIQAYDTLKSRQGGADHPFVRAQMAALLWQWSMTNNAISVTYEDQ